MDIYKHEKIIAHREERVDKYISAHMSLTRSFIQKLFAQENVQVNDRIVKQNYILKNNDEITVKIPTPQPLDIKAEKMNIKVIYEDNHLIVINKERGIVVHPAAGNFNGTLVNGLLSHCEGNLSQINGVIRPGIVHRIDKDTTGLLVVAKSNEAHLKLAGQLKDRELKRQYYALVHGNFSSLEGVINAPISRHKRDRKKMSVDPNGKEAVTLYKVVKNYKGYSLVRCSLKTGRTHQIRVHMNHISHSIVGDKVYGRKKEEFSNLQGQLLHAYKIGFFHPITDKYVEFFAPIPSDFTNILKILKLRQ